MNVLQKAISNAMPYARQYGRALTGDSDYSDLVLADTAAALSRKTLSLRYLLPEKMILPLILAEYHRQLDSKKHGAATARLHTDQGSEAVSDDLLYVQIDQALYSLSELQRRVFLLVTVAQFDMSVVSRVLSLPPLEIKALFQQAHLLLAKNMAAEPARKAA